LNQIDNLLATAIGRPDVIRTAKAIRVLRRWPEIVGIELARACRPTNYEKGTVWIATSSAEWSQELRMQTDRILAELRKQSGEPDLFVTLRFGVRAFEPLELCAPQSDDIVSTLEPPRNGGFAKFARSRIAKSDAGESH
jgi:hypothetical protein